MATDRWQHEQFFMPLIDGSMMGNDIIEGDYHPTSQV
jgi:hypothetical protein